ncbi:carbonic anhydrase 2-like [Mya arenaria]|uniref:carbonic anhydrase 2-like n=1 Tax=Mya arenaria TaxID=6604 RepID=UPI0022E51382|nr:carbonic anhydrase 2-like [Mya arenaria]
MMLLGVVCCILAAQISSVSGSAGNVWTYRGSEGPDNWHLDYPHCGGVKQSPIDVQTKDVVVDPNHLVPIVFSGYDNVANTNYTLGNNGHTVQVDLNDQSMMISEGGLEGTYVAAQFHFHWGADDTRGSEHAINGRHYPMEMHIVHYNRKYGNFTAALKPEDGLAVLGFFFEIGRYNKHFNEIISHFNDIKYRDQHVPIESIPLMELIPARLSNYFRYIGSLTTPPCYESVTWTLFNETIEIAEEQLEKFRTTIFENIEDEGGVSMDISDDFRPVQCLYRRRVHASHQSLRFVKDLAALDDDPSAANVVTSVASIVLFIMALTNICL